MSSHQVVVHSLAETDALGAALAAHLPSGLVVALSGTLGAGKTRFVQAICQAEGVPHDSVTSPTFVLVNEYPGRARMIYHFDAYRLADDDEFLALGPDEYFESPGITLVEWAERVARCLPRERLDVTIRILPHEAREFTFIPHGPRAERAVEGLGEKAEG